MKAEALFSLHADFPFARFFHADAAPWEWVPAIAKALGDFDFDACPEPDCPPGFGIRGPVYIAPGVKLPPFGAIEGPAWIGPGCEIKPGAYIRGPFIAAGGCNIGHACELKNCLLLEGAFTSHYNYVGDTIVGSRAHLGAGAILCNWKFDGTHIDAKTPDGRVGTGMHKLGALIGDRAEVGANAVLMPGSIVGRRAVVMSGTTFNGHLPDGHESTGASSPPRPHAYRLGH